MSRRSPLRTRWLLALAALSTPWHVAALNEGPDGGQPPPLVALDIAAPGVRAAESESAHSSFTTTAPLYLPLAVNGGRPPRPPTAAPTLTPSPLPTDAPPVAGLERAVVLLVDDGSSGDPRLRADRVGPVLDDVSGWFDEVSYGRSRWTFTTHGWLEIPMPPGRGTDRRIFDAAVSAGVNFREYDHVLVVFHGGGPGGVNYPRHAVDIHEPEETYRLEATVSMVTGFRDGSPSRGFIIHELGHALGLPHANHLSQFSGQVVTYGTLTSVMGLSGYLGHLDAYTKHRLGWLDATSVMTATTSGTFTLRPLEVEDGPRLLVVPVEGTGESSGTIPLTDYVIETRRAIGYDANFRNHHNVLDGVLVGRVLARGSTGAVLDASEMVLSLDASPETPSHTSDDFGLMPGRTFSDHLNDIHITVLAVDEEKTTLQVMRDLEEGNRPPRIVSLDVRPDEDSPNTLHFQVDAGDPDGDALSVFWNFEVRGVSSGGWAFDPYTNARYRSGSYGAGETVTHSFSDAMPRTVCAIVSDRRGGSATDCVDVFGAVNVPPEVEVTTAPHGPGTVTFTATVSDRQPTWVWWDFGDGHGSSYVNPTHSYTPPGHYTARIHVSDGQYTTTKEIPVDASQPENVPPGANAGPDKIVDPIERPVELDTGLGHDGSSK